MRKDKKEKVIASFVGSNTSNKKRSIWVPKTLVENANKATFEEKKFVSYVNFKKEEIRVARAQATHVARKVNYFKVAFTYPVISFDSTNEGPKLTWVPKKR